MAKEVKCVQCSSLFYGNSNAMYCSPACKQKGYRGKNSGGVLYALFSGGDVVYIGKSNSKSSAEIRVKAHGCDGTYESKKDFDDYEISDYMKDVSIQEGDYIAKLTPLLNYTLPKNPKYMAMGEFRKALCVVVDEYVNQSERMIRLGGNSVDHISRDNAAIEVEILRDKLIKFNKQLTGQ